MKIKPSKSIAIISALALFLSIQTTASAATLNFSGYNWTLKSGHYAPGPNYWNNNEASIFIDTNNYLHLKVTKVNNIWNSLELYLQNSLGYGTYEFETDSRVDLMDKNLVLGLFLYQDDTHELDIEMSNWKTPGDPNLHYSVQPYNITPDKNTHNTYLTLEDKPSTYKIDWRPDGITYSTWQNGNQINSWTYTGSDNFAPGGETVHMNLWMIDGTPPSDGMDKEVVIKKFTFTPYAAPAPAEISTVTSSTSTTTPLDTSTTITPTTTTDTTTTPTSTTSIDTTTTPTTKTTTSSHSNKLKDFLARFKNSLSELRIKIKKNKSSKN
ncbi:glycoside hydrolase family 16 protein [Candidatus Peregrinibacteria bacterium]|nr:glycoside hydrolase family 16 protein [Candidatus Peregrinibacteria bacterium]